LVNTGSNQGRSQSEGWGDFVAVHMASRAGDNFATGTFAAAQYSTVSFPDEIYYGIRRLPYTRDMAKNPLTFRHIADENPLPMIPLGSGAANNAEVHNAGEIWTSMLWDAYTALILKPGKYSFDQAKQKMADYLVGGMIMTPTDATFSEQRDAILAYVASVDMDDMQLMAGEFARRGLGTCAISPTRYSTNHNGLVESFTNAGKQEIVSVKLDDSVLSCDADGILDGGETGKLTIEVQNNGAVALTNTTVTVTTITPGVIFSGTNTASIASLNAYGKTNVTFDVGLAAGQIAPTKIDLDVDVHNPAGCTAHVALKADNRIDVDDVASNSKTDNVDSEKSTWKATGDVAEVWARGREADGNNLWVGIDYPTKSDTALESADFKVSAMGSFIVTFDHRYAFETSGTTNYDGGVLEITPTEDKPGPTSAPTSRPVTPEPSRRRPTTPSVVAKRSSTRAPVSPRWRRRRSISERPWLDKPSVCVSASARIPAPARRVGKSTTSSRKASTTHRSRRSSTTWVFATASPRPLPARIKPSTNSRRSSSTPR